MCNIVVLGWRDPVVVGYGVVGEIDLQLLQGGIVRGQWIACGVVIAAVGIGEEHHGIVFRGIVVLGGAVIGVDAA